MRAGRFLGFVVFGVTAIGIIGCGGSTAPANPPPATANPNPNAPATIHVFVFNDMNGNGALDANEPGVQSTVTMTKGTICGDARNLTRQDTQPDGKLTLANLEPGPYCIDGGGNYTRTTAGSVKLNLAGGQEVTVNFGVKPD